MFSPLLIAALGLASTTALAAPKEGPEWVTKPYVRPVAGANAFSSGQTSTVAAYAGAQAGLAYRQVRKPLPRLRGNARLQGTYTLGTGNTRGYEVRLGNFIGPQWKSWGIQAGPDFFYNEFQYGGVVAPGTGGAAVPVILNGRLEVLQAYAGVEPAWYFGGSRPGVDWSRETTLGVGDEFSVLAGVGIVNKGMRVGVDYRRRTTSYGTDNNVGLNISLSGLLRR